MEKRTMRLNPAEARLRARPKPLQSLGVLTDHYKAQDEGGLGSLLASLASARREEARRGDRAVRTKRQG